MGYIIRSIALSVLCWLFPIALFTQCMSGTYTIGGTLPNYPDVVSAVNAVCTNGVCGNVIFSIRNGTYPGNLQIRAIPGASSASTIRFTSETGDSSQTIISFSLTSPTPIGMRLDTSSYITFDHITFNTQAPPAAGTYMVYLRGMCRSITFSNCVFNVPSSSTTVHIITPSSNTHFPDFHLYNNKFQNGDYALYLQGHSAAYSARVEIINNIFTDQITYGVNVCRIDSLKFEYNVIQRPTAAAGTIHLEVTQIRGASSIAFNRASGNGHGFVFANFSGSPGDQMIIANNFVQAGGNQGSVPNYALYTTGFNDVKLVHNNFNLLGLTTGNANFEATWLSGTGIDSSVIQNNVFRNSGGGKVLVLPSPSPACALNNNCWYTAGTTKFRYNSINYTSLSAFTSVSGYETSGMFQDPIFTSSTNLHVQNGMLDAAGLPVGIAVDIDGDLRGSPPDLGADEFSPPANSAAATSVETFTQMVCSTVNPIDVLIENRGADTLSSCLIGWKVNNIAQPTYNWTGTLLPDSVQQVTLGTYTFVPNTAYTVNAWTSMPNGVPDPLTLDDTVTSALSGIALSGTYVIGAAPSDFLTFSAAAAALNTYGVCGPTVFNVKNGVYTEQFTLNAITGTSTLNTVTFQSLNGDSTLVTLQGTGAIVVTLNGSRYISFRDMTIQALSLTIGKVFQLQSNARNITFQSCIIRNASGASFSSPSLVYGASNSTCDSLLFDQCLMTGGGHAIYLGNTALSQDASGLIIRNCTIANQSALGIFLWFHKNVTISGNTISTTFLNISYVGMQLYDLQDTVRIIGNRVHVAYGNSSALQLSGSAIASTNICTIANNFFAGGRWGIAMTWNQSGVDLFHNSVYANSPNGYGAVDLSGNSGDWNSLNNIFANFGGGASMNLNGLALIDSCNVNVYYSNSGVAVTGSAPTSSLTLPAWQALSGHDLNSWFGNPNYTSPGNLHITVSSVAGNHGTPIATLPRDIDGAFRSLITPDIGADEFIPIGDEAGLVALSPTTTLCNATTNVSVVFRNNGSSTLTSLSLYWTLNGVPQPQYNWTGSILTDSVSPIVTIGSFVPVLNGQYIVRAWLATPNGNPDLYSPNDTLQSDTLGVGVYGTFTIGGTSPDFVTINDAFNFLETNGICSPVILDVRDGEYMGVCHIGPINGTNAVNTITLQSESGDSSAVVLTNDTLSGELVPPLWFDTASYIMVRKLTFRTNLYPSSVTPNSSSQVPGDLIVIRDFCNNITIESCAFYDGQTRQNFTYPLHQCAIGIYPNWGSDHHINIRNNHFFQGSAGIYSMGDTLSIENNVFEDQFMCGIYLFGNNRVVTITNNTILAQRFNASYTSIWSASTEMNQGVIAHNYIHAAYGVRAIQLFSTVPGRIVIANNIIIQDSASNSNAGLIDIQADTVVICYNTVRAYNGTGATILRMNYGKGFIYNNCFNNNSGGLIYDLYFTTAEFIDNNAYYTVGGTFGKLDNAPHTNLTSWRTALPGSDLESFSTPTLFQLYYPYVPGDTTLSNKGVALVEFQNDYRGLQRDTVTPDIGAIEYTPVLIDAGVIEMNDAALTCDGTHTLQINVANFGLTPITSIEVNWSVNGINQPAYTWSGNIGIGQISSSITVGSFTSINGTAEISVWTSQPNGQTDSISSNDTLWNDPHVGPLSGTYVVGAGGDFSMLTDAFAALAQRGICGPVTLSILPGDYCESPTLSAMPGASMSDTLLICTSTGQQDVEFYRSTNSTITAQSCLTIATGYVTLRNLSFDPAFQAPNSYTFYGLKVDGDYTRIDSCLISGSRNPNQTWVYNELACVLRGEHVEMKNCSIVRTYYGMNMNASMSAPPWGHSRLLLFNNYIEGLSEIRYLANSAINRNIFTQQLYSIGHAGPNTIDRNQFNGLNFSSDGTPVDSTRITNNFFNRGTDIGGDYILIANNTFNLDSIVSSASGFARGATETRVINNIFHAEPGIGPPRTDAVNTTGVVSDYNTYWVRNNPGAASAILLNLQGLGFDNNSVVINPLIGVTDLHTQNALFNGQGIPVGGLTEDIDGDLRPSSPAIGADEIAPPAFEVWPGNSNNDTIVDNFDILPIGVHYGTNGYSRWSMSIAWQGYLALDWNSTQANGQDLKHVDCNGDSIINSIDTLAVSTNYGLIDLFPMPPPQNNQQFRTAPPVYIVTNQSNYAPGDLVTAEIWAGDSTNPFVGVYGIGFHIIASSSAMGNNDMNVTFSPNWLGQPSVDLYSIDRTHSAIERFDGSIVRFDHQSRSGYGKIADITFRIDSGLTASDTVQLLFSELQIIDSNGVLLPYSTPINEFAINALSTPVSYQENEFGATVYPNPFSNTTTLSFSNPTNQWLSIELINSLGERVVFIYEGSLSAGVHTFVLDRTDVMSAGLYQVVINSDSGTSAIRLIIE